MRGAGKCWIGAATIIVTSTCFAAANTWTSLGPDGGFITALVIDSQNTSTVYAATKSNGVFKSIDAGATWTAMNSGLDRGTVGTLAMDPRNSRTLYAAVVNHGVFKSVDGGQSWSPARSGLPYTHPDSYIDINALAIDPADPATVFAGTGSGVFKTTDGGANWIAVNFGLPPYVLVTSLALDPSRPTTLYMGGMVTAYGPSGESTYLAIFRTTDSGANWSVAASPFASSWYGIPHLLIDPRDDGTLYAGFGTNGIFKSVDGGATWNAANSGLPADYGRTLGLAMDPQDSDTLYALMIYSGACVSCTRYNAYINHPGRLFRSRDGGTSWFEIDPGLPRASFDPVDYCSCVLTKAALAVDPAATSTLYIGTDSEGVFKSVDSGASWNISSTGLRAQPVRVTLEPSATKSDRRHSGTLYAASDLRIFKSADAGGNWTVGPWGSPDIYVWPLTFDPQHPDTVYAGSAGLEDWWGGFFQSVDRGITWRRITLPDHTVTTAFNVAFDPRVPAIAYAAGIDLYKTTDGGLTWTTTDFPEVSVQSVVIDPKNSSTVYLGACCSDEDGGTFLYKSVNGGATWSLLPFAARRGCCDVSLVVDPQNSSILYTLALGSVFKSSDGGMTWQPFNSGLPQDSTVSLLAIDPHDPTKLYAGTRNGVFRTTDAAANWYAVGSGLPGVLSLALDPQDPCTLYAGTNGGVYVITFTERER